MSAPTPTVIKPRPYRRFLTSALHTRFIHATLVSFGLCLHTAFWTGQEKSLFWSWFPFGSAGLRASLFFMTPLFLYIIHIATLTIGRPTATSPFQYFRTTLLSLRSLQTLFWYLVSAWWFTEVYIWSKPSLGWIARGDMHTPDRLNERPIYMRAFFLQLGCLQAWIHLYLDQSSLRIPFSPAPTPQANVQTTHPVDSSWVQLQKQGPFILIRTTLSTLVMVFVGPVLYWLFLRQFMWRLHLAIAKPFFNLSRSNAHISGIPPIHNLMPRSFVAGFLLMILWELSTLAFSIYMIQEPSKKGLPLSTSSTDPNGTLLNGLKAKRSVVKTFAFWELAGIAQKQPERRQAIFADIDRITGPTWPQMLDEALKIIQAIDQRITAPSVPQTPAAPPTITNLPKIVRPVSQARIEQNPAARGLVSRGSRSIGSSPSPWREPADSAVRMIENSTAAGLEASKGPWSQALTTIRTSPIGWFFSVNNTAKINAVVLGSPNANTALIVDAIEATTKMSVASLAEDTYGKAIAGVPTTVKAFTKTINSIEAFIQQNHEGVTSLNEVGIVLDRLKASLRELLSAFQVYLVDQGLGIGELNEAKKAAEQRDLLPKKKAPNEEKRRPAQQRNEMQETPSKPPAQERRRRDDQQQQQQQPQQKKPQQSLPKPEEPQQKRPADSQRQNSGQRANNRKDWNGMNGQPERRREMEMVR